MKSPLFEGGAPQERACPTNVRRGMLSFGNFYSMNRINYTPRPSEDGHSPQGERIKYSPLSRGEVLRKRWMIFKLNR